ncbi:set1/Ash2 histone methyltransferase complex subunit ASH2-like [Mya arenaria]|uniref:set1/Ash2 histone methyltransferase complex subunit ASH2-like n=1 Tax=Mya arenaria TaxID=6604 RepID=UPI0022E37110|nr:set1/Ash2 histone methyltransferase complex subunit ASH2-like [Mya arenaria]
MDSGGLPHPSGPGMQQDEELCYCGKGRNLGTVELQCQACSRWYHADCTSCYIGTCIPFMCNYIYQCKHCNENGLESFQKKQASFQQICYTTLANLTFLFRNDNRVMFSRDKEIIPFIEKQWENMTTMPRRVKLTWHNTVNKTLAKETDIFYGNETTVGDTQYGLLNSDLYKVTPAFEILTKGNTQIQALQKPGVPVDKGLRGQKRKANQDTVQVTSTKMKKGDVLNLARLAPHGYPTEHPFNKDGYRYILAEPDPHAPNRQAYDESVEWAGKPIPGYLYRTFLGSQVLLALHDRAPQLKISDDRLSVTGEKGYSMIRATHGVRSGSWYYEVQVDEMPENTATRIGWSQQQGNLQAPCGYDKFSYSWRSRKGSKSHQSYVKLYSEPYKEGDVLGFYISLPELDNPNHLVPVSHKDKPLVKFKNHLYYEEKDQVSEAEKALTINPGSKICFFLNGKFQGVAYEDLFEGTYYPAISLYKLAKVTVNFGPSFKCQPDKIQPFQPMSETAQLSMVENTLSDMLFHVENEGKLPDFQN